MVYRHSPNRLSPNRSRTTAAPPPAPEPEYEARPAKAPTGTKLCNCGGYVQANYRRGDLVSVQLHHLGYGDHRIIEELDIEQWYANKIESAEKPATRPNERTSRGRQSYRKA